MNRKTITAAVPCPDHATRPPAKSADRRRAHPLTADERKMLELMPYIECTGDLETIPLDRRRRALDFLSRMTNGAKTGEALNAAHLTAWELSWVRTHSQTFRAAHEMMLDARMAVAKERMLETLTELANGEFVPRPGCLPPEVRAASLLLPALDPRFRGNPAPVQQVQINIGI